MLLQFLKNQYKHLQILLIWMKNRFKYSCSSYSALTINFLSNKFNLLLLLHASYFFIKLINRSILVFNQWAKLQSIHKSLCLEYKGDR